MASKVDLRYTQHSMCFNIGESSRLCRGFEGCLVFSGGERICSYLAEDGRLIKSWHFEKRICYVSCNPLSVLVVGCADGSVWSCKAVSEPSSKKQKVSSYAPVHVYDCKQDFECMHSANGKEVVYCGAVGPNSFDVLFVSSEAPNQVQACLNNASHVIASFEKRVTCVLRVDASFCCLDDFDGFVIVGTIDGAVYCVSDAGEKPKKLIEENGSKVLEVFPACFEFLDQQKNGMINCIVVVVGNGVVNIIQSQTSVRTYVLGFSIEHASLEKSNLLVSSLQKNNGRPMSFSFGDGFPRHLVPRSIEVAVSCSSLLIQNDIVWMVLKNGVLYSCKVKDEGKWPVIVSSMTIKDAVESIVDISKRQAIQKEQQNDMTQQLLDLNASLKLYGARDTILTTIEAKVRNSGMVSICITIQNESPIKIGKNWCVVVGVQDHHYSFPVVKDVPPNSVFNIEVCPVIVKSYLPLTVSVSMLQLIKEVGKVSTNHSVSFAPCSAISMSLKRRIITALDLCESVDALNIRSLSPKAPERCLLHGEEDNSRGTALRTFRFVGYSEHMLSVKEESLQSIFGNRFNIVLRPLSNANFQEMVLSCYCEESEAIAIRAAVLWSILEALPDVLKVKVSDWKQAKHDLKELQTRTESCSSIAELSAVYNELRRIQLKF